MSKNIISVEMPKEVATQVSTKLQEIKTLLAPYLGVLTAEERASLPKMGDKSLAFVSKVVEYTTTNPQFIPAMMNADEFKKDFKANQDLIPIQAVIKQIGEMLKDTSILTGHEAYVQALYYYASVKMFAKTGDSAAKAVLEDLSKRFPKGKKTVAEDNKTE